MNSRCVHCYVKDGAVADGAFIFQGTSLCPRHLVQMWELRFVGTEASIAERGVGESPTEKPTEEPGGLDSLEWVDP